MRRVFYIWLVIICLAAAIPSLSTRAQPANGTIETFDMLLSTYKADYYRVTYWSDGLRIQAFYAEPKDKTKTFPAIIFNRGGSAAGGWNSGIELVPFAEAGYVAVSSQYRGSAGSEGTDEFGGADVDDVLALIPLLKSRSLVDPTRIGMWGTSRGAMMTYLALRRQTEAGTRDIKVAVTTSGVADLIMWANERADLNDSFYPSVLGTTTVANPDLFKQRSATYWYGKIRTPLLIMHGDADWEVSIQQSLRLYRLLRSAGRTVKMVTFKGDIHGLPNNGNGSAEGLRWLQRYLAKPGEDLTFETHAADIEFGQNYFKGGH